MVALFFYPVTPHWGVPTRFLQEESARAASAGRAEGAAGSAAALSLGVPAATGSHR